MVESILICAFAAWVLERVIFTVPSKIRWAIATVFMTIIWHVTLYMRG